MAPTRPKSKQTHKKPKAVAAEIAKDDDDDGKPGCVYIGHVPHGFYEEQMKDYFSQFGHVLAVKLCRSKKNGNSKGYAFVKFRYAAVAKTVSETCNNYLFFNKLLKCQYKPMSEIHKATFRKWVWKPKTTPKRKFNNSKSELKLALSMKKSLSKVENKLEKLKNAGLDGVDINEIMDVPDLSEINKLYDEYQEKKLNDATTTKESSKSETPKKKKKAIKSSHVRTKAKPPKKKVKTVASSDVTTSEPPKKRVKTVASPGVTTTSEPPKKRVKTVASSDVTTTSEPPKKRVKTVASSPSPSVKDQQTRKSPKSATKNTELKPIAKKTPVKSPELTPSLRRSKRNLK